VSVVGKILVLYHSDTGHTRTMAEQVAQGASTIAGMEVRLKSVDEATQDDVLWCDGVAAGSPTNLGLMSWPMKRFWDGVCKELWGKIDGKIGCAFSSSGGWGGGAELTCASLLTLLMNFGFLVFGVTDYVDEKLTLHYGAVTAGEPRREAEIEACRRLGKRLAQWVAVYVDGRKECHPGPISERR
jgi:NAD(P)H dehydrogenase (quinone)